VPVFTCEESRSIIETLRREKKSKGKFQEERGKRQAVHSIIPPRDSIKKGRVARGSKSTRPIQHIDIGRVLVDEGEGKLSTILMSWVEVIKRKGVVGMQTL